MFQALCHNFSLRQQTKDIIYFISQLCRPVAPLQPNLYLHLSVGAELFAFSKWVKSNVQGRCGDLSLPSEVAAAAGVDHGVHRGVDPTQPCEDGEGQLGV